MEEREGDGSVSAKEAILFKAGERCMIKTRPCYILEYRRYRLCKHGSQRIDILGTDLFTTLKYKDTFLASRIVDIPDVHFSEHRVVGFEDERVVWFDTEEGVKHLTVPEGEVGRCVWEMVETGRDTTVRVMQVDREEAIVGARISEE